MTIDPETITILTSIAIGGGAGLAYGIYSYLTKTDPGQFEGKRLVASAIFGMIIGFGGAYTVIQAGIEPSQAEWWVVIGGLFLTYSGMQVYVNRFVDWIWLRYFGAKFLARPIFSPAFQPGFTVKPAFIDIKSGETIALGILVTPSKGEHKVSTVTIDWGDDVIQEYVPINGELYIGHQYTYSQGQTKYTGHTFYPRFTVKLVDGNVKTFNTQTSGRCCAIGVSSNE